MENYIAMDDNKLQALSQLGDRRAEEQLVMRYSRVVRMCARPFFLAGGDAEDLMQEGMMGLLSAVREFNSSLNISFKTYAESCIKNQIGRAHV